MKRFRPKIPNPYPIIYPQCVVSDFQYIEPLYLGRSSEVLPMPGGREAQYFVARDYTVEFRVDGIPRSLTVPAGCLTDLASVPRFFRGYIGRVGPHLEACIIHDFLFIAWQLLATRGDAGREDWRFANAVLYAGLQAAEVSGFQRWLFRRALNSEVSWQQFRWRDDGPDGKGLFVEVPA